jgi:hypothetical protein
MGGGGIPHRRCSYDPAWTLRAGGALMSSLRAASVLARTPLGRSTRTPASDRIVGVKSYRPYSPLQPYLLLPSPQEWLPDEHLVYFVLSFVAAEIEILVEK